MSIELDSTKLFFSAISLFFQRNPTAFMLVVGSLDNHSDRFWFSSMCKQYGIEGRVKVTGWLSQEQALKRLANCDVAINLLDDNILLKTSSPTKVVEYAALGIPVVVTDSVPDQSYCVVKMKSGVVVENTAEAIANGLAEAIKIRRDNLGVEIVNGFRDYDTISSKLYTEYIERMR
ncbi:glycosyltransferase [Vibrio variabilis]|uniref:glycosyltransferase n=1 Tax=Vibrio variabilis TaxID=990271 RepID=UPI000DD9F218|nr:glycosyltransferase [Vibrio variabilis]